MKTCFYHRAKSDNKLSLEEQKELVRRCAEDDGFIVRDNTDCGNAEPSECPMLMKMKKRFIPGGTRYSPSLPLPPFMTTK